jgi:hypothetical protein
MWWRLCDDLEAPDGLRVLVIDGFTWPNTAGADALRCWWNITRRRARLVVAGGSTRR